MTVELSKNDFITLFLLSREEMDRAEKRAIEAMKKHGENSTKFMIADGYFQEIYTLNGKLKSYIPQEYR